MRIRFARPLSFLSRRSPENIFLILASCLVSFYLLAVFPLTVYAHAPERFLHVVHYAMAWTGNPGRMPIGFLELVQRSRPGNLLKKYPRQTKLWDKELGSSHFSDKKPPKGRGRHKTISRLGSIEGGYDRTVPFVTNSNPAMYSVVGYIPFIIPAAVGIMMGAKPLAVLYAGIISNAIFSILLGYYAVRITPALKWLFVFLLLVPSVCLTRVLIMPDAVVLGLCLLIIAMAMRGKAEAQPLALKSKVSFVMLSVMAGLIKITYFLVPTLGWLIPSACFRGESRKILWVGAAVLVSAGAAVAWSIHALPAAHITIPSISDGKFTLVDVLAGTITLPFSVHQWLYWLNNIFFWNISIRHNLYGPTALGLIIMGGMCLLALTFFPSRDSKTFTLTPSERGICGMIFFVTMAIIIAAVSLQVHQITAKGRYLIPILPLLSLVIYRPAMVARVAPFIAPYAVGISGCCLGIFHYYMLSRL